MALESVITLLDGPISKRGYPVLPTGPNGEKRPADVNACAVMVAKLATGEITEEPSPQRAGGLAGGPARAESLSPEERSEIAKRGAQARWGKD